MVNEAIKPAWYRLADEWSDEHVHHCICGGARYFRVNFPLGHPLFGKAIPCACVRSQHARERGERLRRMSGMSAAQLLEHTFGSFDPRLCRPQSPDMRAAMAGIKRQCEEFARNPRGWLVLVGDVGSGKTHLAAAIAGESLKRNRPVFMTTMPRLLDLLRAGYDDVVGYEERVRLLEDIDLLVIDDLCAERRTEWGVEQAYSLINARYHKRLPMVITSNVNLAQADGLLDARVLSRLREGTQVQGWSRIITLPCADVRAFVTAPEAA